MTQLRHTHTHTHTHTSTTFNRVQQLWFRSNYVFVPRPFYRRKPAP
jgi:hypothetical protein